ncbi:glycosyltransferase family 4 protein [Sorangium sp. So ce134]
MRILFVVQNYPPERGPVRYTASLAAGLAARGHDVRVLTALPHYPDGIPHAGFGRLLPKEATEDGVRVVRLPVVMASNTELVRRLAGMASFAAASLPPALLGARPDVVVASLPPVTTALAALAAARRHRARLVMLLRDVEPKISLELRGVDGRPWAGAAVRAFTGVYDRADRLVVVHPSQVASLTDFGVSAAKVEVIPHGIDVAAFERQAARGAPGVLPRRPGRAVALYVGTIGVAHDVARLVRAFADRAVRDVPVDLVLVGHGEQAPECERLARELSLDSVFLRPPVPLEDVPALLRQADVLVSSYRTLSRPIDGMIGSKFYEYFSAGKPVLVSGEGAAADLVTSIGNGLCVPPGDAPALARALRALVGDPERARAMGARGKAYAQQHFSLAERHDRWERLLRDVCAAGRGEPRGPGGSEGSASRAAGRRLELDDSACA